MSTQQNTGQDNASAAVTLTPTTTDSKDSNVLVHEVEVTEHEKIQVEAELVKPEINEFEDNSNIPVMSYWQIFLLSLYFGIHAWGGPVAQIALIQEKLVIKGKWITPKRFQRAFGVYAMLPGPEATELAMYFGCLAGGRIGGLLGGLGFCLPGFVLVLLLSYIYVVAGLDNQYFNASFRALQPIVAAMVLRAAHKIAQHTLVSHTTHKFDYWLGFLAILAGIQVAARLNFLITMGVFATATMVWRRGGIFRYIAIFIIGVEWVCYIIYIAFHGIPGPAALGIGVAKTPDPEHMLGLGLLAGSISFGGAYTTIPFLKAEAVTIGKWLTEQQFLDTIAIGNVLPAPLVMFSCSVGFLGGNNYGGLGYAFLNAVLITFGMFFPCFFFTILGHSLLEKLVKNKFLSAFFDGITGSVIGIIGATALDLLKSSVTTSILLRRLPQDQQALAGASQDSISAVIYLLALGALYGLKIKFAPLVLVIVGAIAGQFLFIDGN